MGKGGGIPEFFQQGIPHDGALIDGREAVQSPIHKLGIRGAQEVFDRLGNTTVVGRALTISPLPVSRRRRS